MAVTIEAARREMSSVVLDLFGLQAEKHTKNIETCGDLVALRIAVFAIVNEIMPRDQYKSGCLVKAWEELGLG